MSGKFVAKYVYWPKTMVKHIEVPFGATWVNADVSFKLNERPRGVVVAVGANKIGYAYISDKDYGLPVTKKSLLRKALARANGGAPIDNAPEELVPVIEAMKDRAKRYYK